MESELVSGFMTEHSAVIFVFFFLAEYASIVLICILISILFLGGYSFASESFIKFVDIFFDFAIIIISPFLYGLKLLVDLITSNYEDNSGIVTELWYEDLNNNYIITNFSISSLYYSLTLGVKTSLFIFLFIWVRASFPRIRFDQLMTDCWTIILPLVFGFVVFIPCLMWTLDILPNNILYY